MLTPEQRDDVEEVPTRQPGCPDKGCSVCRANKRRTEAVAHVLLEHDRLERELADERAAHAVTQAERNAARRDMVAAMRDLATMQADRDEWVQVSRDWRVRAESAEQKLKA